MADVIRGAYLLIRHLIEQGHRRIVFMCGGNDNDILRLKGYKKALKESAVPFDENLLIYAGEEIEGAYGFVEKVLKLKERPTAIFAINDLLAIGVIDGLEKKGLKVPGDIALVGYDNIKWAAHKKFSLTTIDYPTKKLTQLSMKVLLDQIKGRANGPQQIMIKPRLIIRQSSRKGG